MNYAKIENKELHYAPIEYITSEGLIINFNKDEELMKRYGFKEVVDIKPEYDKTTQCLIVEGYEEQDEYIIINYAIKQIDLVQQEETIEEKVIQLKNTDSDHEVAIAELYELILGGV